MENRTLEDIIDECLKLPLDGNAKFVHEDKSISVYRDFEHEALYDIHFYDADGYVVNSDIEEGFLGGVDIMELGSLVDDFLFAGVISTDPSIIEELNSYGLCIKRTRRHFLECFN